MMDLSKELEIYYSMIYAEYITETKLINLLIVLKEKCERVLKFASNYDYDENHAFNGYRSTVLFVVRFLEAVHCTKLNENFDGTVDEVILIFNALNKTLTSVLKFHEKSLRYHDRLSNDKENDEIFKLQIPIDKQSLMDAFEQCQDTNTVLIFNKYYEFFYKGNNLNNINQTMLSNFLENFDPWSWFKAITNSTFSDTSLFFNINQLGIDEIEKFGSSQLNAVKNWFPFLSNNRPYIVETITIKRQLEWLICPITFELKSNPMKFQVLENRKKIIKCKLIRNTVNSSGHLLMYLFPSDYFSQENYDISNSFLIEWSNGLPGCSILIPELVYDNNEKYTTPLQLQDCLDCYLWAIGKNNQCINKIELLNKSNNKQFNSTNSNENLSLKRTAVHNSHSRSSSLSSSIGGLSSYFNNGLTSNYNSIHHDSPTKDKNSSIYTSTKSTNRFINTNETITNSSQILDGIPEHITLSADSFGGTLATSLLLVLNDLKTKFNYKDLKLPDALVLAFTPFNLRDYSPITLTSRFRYSLSPIIALTSVKSNLPLPEIEDHDLITLKKSKKLDNSSKLKSNDNKKSNIDVENCDQMHQKEILKQDNSKRSTEITNKYLVDRLNECKLSDLFHQFSYLDENDTNQIIDEENELIDEEMSDDSDRSDDDRLSFNESNVELNLNLSYFAKTLMSYLSQYYNTYIPTAQINSFVNQQANGENLKKTNLKEEHRLADQSKIKRRRKDKINENIDKKVTNNNLRSNLEEIKLENQESLIQNAFTMFRLFFNNREKKPNETLEWNKEIVEKIFNEQRENAFYDLTTRPYISPAFYDDFESLENTRLYLLNSTCDMFLDDNICMSKRWKGNVTLKILDDQLPRGFLIERFLQDAKESQMIFFDMVKEAIELKKPLPKFLQQN